ncbi:MAG: DUF3786 domain-containing protein [Pseudomonadota bacterium]
MTQFKNAMEVFRLLPKTNCRKCNDTTCLAFASKVFLGQKNLDQCPYVESQVLNIYQGQSKTQNLVEQQQETLLKELKQQIAACDLKAAAQRTGGVWANGKLTLRIFGKPFSINNQGEMFSDIHINPWITSTVLGYVLACKGVALTGKWLPFRELDGGREKNGLFVQRSENSFKQIADQYTGFFEDLILLFNGQKTDNLFESDISLVLSPLPKLPILVCYWKPEEEMASDLHLFFDSSANTNATIDIVYGIAAGIVTMFEKISQRHGIAG